MVPNKNTRFIHLNMSIEFVSGHEFVCAILYSIIRLRKNQQFEDNDHTKGDNLNFNCYKCNSPVKTSGRCILPLMYNLLPSLKVYLMYDKQIAVAVGVFHRTKWHVLNAYYFINLSVISCR
jgi:hypothetical protein